MSKLACRCGHIISDVTYPSPTEGQLTGQQDSEPCEKETIEAVGAFLSAIRSGSRQQWIRDFFLSEEYPQDLPDESVISDILLVFNTKYRRSVAECDHCGRLWIQLKVGENQYKSYFPDEGGYNEVLRSKMV